MYAVIYGTGKWARTLGNKIKDHGLLPVHIGSDDRLALFSRSQYPKFTQGYPLFILSKTENHFKDLKDCLPHLPKEIYIEKGFSSATERQQAKELVGNIPVFFLSQYRFSQIFEDFLKEQETICGIKYNWYVEQHSAQEWMHHIVSIDNYLKNNNCDLYVEHYGHYVIDSISQVNIVKSEIRSLIIEIETTAADYTIELGKTNILKRGPTILNMVENEDCLSEQISQIINAKKEKLERL